MSDIKYIDDLATCFEMLPGVGKKTAQRYAYSIIEKATPEEVENFAKLLIDTKKNIKKCSKCGMLTTNDTCDICKDNSRDHSKLMVVKDSKDIVAIEKTGQYNGYYHSLNGLISVIDGIGPDEIRVKELEERLNEEVKEVILAMPFTPYGEATAIYLEKILKKNNIEVTRLGYGLPAGGDIEYIDELTLSRAISNRRTN